MALPADMNVNRDDGIIRRKIPLQTDDVDFNKACGQFVIEASQACHSYQMQWWLVSLNTGSAARVIQRVGNERGSTTRYPPCTDLLVGVSSSDSKAGKPKCHLVLKEAAQQPILSAQH
uniref:Uncharacterized protein n=1 Tax=Timema genevievae TaxID=629358 RepID=A0A7R9K6E9_TIMGE|nr:unnamed protein product [Timema genevievae]